jgi:hypothetical protein
MRKTFSGLLIMGLLTVGISRPALGDVRSVKVNLDLGIIKQKRSDSFIFAYGAGVDIPLGLRVIFSPEVQYWTEGFFLFGKKKEDQLILGAILNLDMDSFFMGGGLVWLPYGELLSTKSLIKINAGFRAKHIKISVYLLTDLKTRSDDYDCFGASIGYVF